MSAAPIVTEGLTKRFRDVLAVENLSFSVDEGEVFGFLGPNGAGKTTTIRLLLDMIRPSAGRAQIMGKPSTDFAVRTDIGFLPAELHFDRRHTVEEAINYYLRLRQRDNAGNLRALYERFQLDPGRRIGELSTGNRRKIGVVVAFAGHAKLLILDEPTTGLDPLLQHELLSLVQERVSAGTTVLMSSHVLPEVQRVATRFAVLREGRLALLGSTDDLRRRARHELELHFGVRTETPDFSAIPEVISMTPIVDGVALVIEGSIDNALRHALKTTTVERIVARDSDLEDAFLEIYR